MRALPSLMLLVSSLANADQSTPEPHAGAAGVEGGNLGILGAVAWEAAEDPWAGTVAVGADSDGAGP